MRRSQLPRLVSWSRAFASTLAWLAFVWCVPASAQAQPIITSGNNYGTYSIGDVELPLSATGGTGTYTWSIVGGAIPPGLSIRQDVPAWFPSTATTGLIGQATTPGTYVFDVQVNDGVGTAVMTNVTVKIASLFIRSPYGLPDGFEGSPYSVQLVAGNAAGPLTWSANGAMPPGLSLASDGTLTGTPTMSGFFNVPYSVTDGVDTLYWNHNVGIFPVQIATNGLLPYATVGQAYSQTITASGGSGGFTFSMGGGLPDGLTFNAGTISGTPTQSGRWTFNLTATDSSNHSYSKDMSLVVVAVPGQLPQVQPYGPRLDDCAVGTECQRAIGNWSAAQPPFTWSAAGLPPGMSIRWGSGIATQYVWPDDGELWGVPTAAGNYSVTVTVTDGTGATATNTFPLHVSTIALNAYPPNGAIGAAYSHVFRLLGGSGSYTGALTGGALPLGLSFNASTLSITGTPTEGGSFSPQFTFDDGMGQSFTATTYLFIGSAGNASQPLSINNSDLGNATLNAPFQYQLSACCRASIVWSLESGTPPAGLTLSASGLLSGTPTAGGPHAFVVRATDGMVPADYTTRQLTLNVTPVFISMNTTLPIGNVSVPYGAGGAGVQLQASGGTGPYEWTLASGSYLPPGLSLTSNGLLAGTPSASGQFFFNVNVRDVVTQNRTVGYFSLSIYPFGTHPPLRITTNGNFGTWGIGTVQTELDAADGAGSYTWSLVGGALPDGMAVRADGAPWFSPSASGGIIGVATTPGTYAFTLRVTDQDGATRDLAGTMRIVPLTIKDLWNVPDAFTNTAYSYTLTPLGNVGAVTWGAPNCGNPSCGLPPGLALNSVTGEISGTPTTPGFYNPQISVSADGATLYWNLNIGVYAVNVGTSTSLAGGGENELPNATQGQAYSVTFTASGGTGPYTFSANSLPNGLSLNPATGVVSGTYNGGGGRYWFSVTATDSTATSYTRSFSIRGATVPAVLPSVGINGGRFDDCTLGMPCNRGMWVASGAAAPFTWSATGLPAGMSVRPGGVAYSNDGTPAGDAVIWGVPTELGDFDVTITVTDATGAQASGVIPLHVSELWLDTRLPNGTYATGYGPGGLGAQLRVIGGSASYSTALVAPTPNNRLAAGLSLDGARNRVMGVPLETGSFSPDLLITDTANPAHTLRQFNYFFIADAGIGTLQINTGTDLGYWPLNANITYTFSACCVPSYAWSLESGSLPPGTSLNPTGQLTGTLSTPGSYTFALRVADASFPATNFAVRQFTLVVTPLTQSTAYTLPFGNVGTPYGQTLHVAGATGATTFTLDPLYSVLPPGITLSSAGVLSGTPTASGQFNFSVSAGDAGGNTLRLYFSLSIYPAGATPPLNFTIGPSFGPFTIGQVTISWSGTSVSGGVGPYHFSLTPGANVIPGMRVQDGQPLPTFFATQNPVPTAGFIGVIENPGVYTTSIRVTDTLGHTFDRPITLTVSPLVILTAPNIPKATVLAPYSFFLTASGASGIYSWSGTNLPPGLSIDSSTGELHGTPTTAGSGNITVTLTDVPSGQSVSTSLTLVRNAFAITTGGALPPATNSQFYSQQLAAPGCASCAWSVSPGSSLPNGLSVSGSGLLSGSPTGTGTFTFTIRATATGGVTVDKLFALVIGASLPQALVVTTGPNLSATTVGFNTTTQFNATGGTPPYVWALDTGSLPSGISFASSGDTVNPFLAPGVGYLIGRPLHTGTYTFTLRVTDSALATATQTFSWNISAINLQYTTLPLRDNLGNLIGPALNRGSSYTQPLLAIGGTSNYTWTATLPSGLSINASTGVVTGTPLDGGTFNVPVTITDDGGHSFTGNENLIVSGGGPAFGAGATQGPFAQGASLSVNLSPSGGTAPYTVTALTPLPPGFALEAGAAVLSNGTPGSSFFLAGAPQAAGVFTFTLQVQDSLGAIGQRTFTLTVSPVSILTTTLADGSVGAPYSQQLVAFDAAGAATWNVSPGSGLPAGLTLSPAGLLSGTPTNAGGYGFNLQVKDSSTGVSVTSSFSLKISPLAITGAGILPMATVGTPYTYTFGVTGAAGTVTWNLQGGVPNGLSLSPVTGTISGTPLGGNATIALTVTATDDNNTPSTSDDKSVTRRFTLFVHPVNPLPPSLPLLQTQLPDGAVGQSYSASFTPNAGLPPFVWSVPGDSSLPPGLSLVSGAQLPSTFFPGQTIIAGQPTAAGQYTFDLVVTDANLTPARRTFTLNVSSITILSGNLRTATAGQAYAEQLTVVGGSAPYTFTASLPPSSQTADLLPSGITLSSSGLLSGTTTSTGVYTLVIRAQDASGQSFARSYQFTVNNPSGLRVTNANPGDVYVGSGFAQDLFTNGPSTYSWSVTAGALPPGLSLGTDPLDPTAVALIGQPSAAGVYTYTLRATDTVNGSNFADHAFTLNVSPMQPASPPLFNYVIPNAQVGVAYSTTFRMAGGTPPYSFSASPAGPIPAGLMLAADGTLSGTPTQVGVFSVAVIATDSAGRVYHLPSPSLVVTPTGIPGPIAAQQNTQLIDDGSVGVPFRFALVQQRGGVAPFSWTLTAGSSLPAGLAIVVGGNGVPDYLAGVPTTAGSYAFSLTVTDSIGQSVSTPYLFKVSPLALTPDTLAPGRVGAAYTATLAPVGGVGPYTMQLLTDWDLPPGLALSPTGVLAGTPTAPGVFAMRVLVTDHASHTLSKLYLVDVDNAIGEAPAATLAPRSIQLSYTRTFADPGPIAVGINTTSGTPAYTVAVEGIPGATLSAAGGAAPGSVSLDLHVTTLGVGTYSGVLALKSAATTNQNDAIPITVTVAQLPDCTYSVSPSSTTFGPGGGSDTFDLATAGQCSWAASVSQPSWISLTSGSTGTGAATIGFTIAPNAGASPRTGTITVSGSVYTITQFGSGCSFVVNPLSLSASASGGIASIGVTASDSTCGWTATGLSASPAAGSGNGTVTVAIPANPATGGRQLTASIAGQTFTVNQQGIDCTVAVDPASASFSDAGGIGSSTITTPAACEYATTSTPSWVTVNSGGSGTGPGTLQYIVNANSATTPRTGSIIVGGQTVTISQGAAACSVTLDTAALGSPFGAAAGSGAIGVVANGNNCAWSVSGSANWVTFQPNASSGSGTVGLAVAANTSVLSRTASVSIAGQTVTISQSGQACSYALQSPTGTVPAGGGSGTVGVLTPAACNWTPVSSDPSWLSVGPGAAGSGDASFVATANPNPSPRSATVTIAGLLYTVTQPAAACTYTLVNGSAVTVSGDGTSGASFGVTSGSAACTPAPVSYANWITIDGTSFVGTAGTVTFTVQPNPLSVSRTGSIQVGDQTFTVTETLSQSACNYSLHEYGAVFSRGGGGGDVFGSGSAVGCDPTATIGTDQPGFISLLPLQGPVNDIFTQPFSVTPFDTPLTAVIRRGRITFGGQIFVVKQVSW